MYPHSCTVVMRHEIYLQGPAMVVLTSGVHTLLQERLIAEAPWLMFRGGYYYLLYSSGWTHEPKYHIRVARARTVTGPYVRHSIPVITTDWNRFNKVWRRSEKKCDIYHD